MNEINSSHDPPCLASPLYSVAILLAQTDDRKTRGFRELTFELTAAPLPPVAMVGHAARRLRLRLSSVEKDLRDPSRFGSALTVLQSPDFQKKSIKRVFNAYSDNIYYTVS